MNQVNVFDLKFGDRIRVINKETGEVTAGKLINLNAEKLAILPDERLEGVLFTVFNMFTSWFRVEKEPEIIEEFNPEKLGFILDNPTPYAEGCSWKLKTDGVYHLSRKRDNGKYLLLKDRLTPEGNPFGYPYIFLLQDIKIQTQVEGIVIFKALGIIG